MWKAFTRQGLRCAEFGQPCRCSTNPIRMRSSSAGTGPGPRSGSRSGCHAGALYRRRHATSGRGIRRWRHSTECRSRSITRGETPDQDPRRRQAPTARTAAEATTSSEIELLDGLARRPAVPARATNRVSARSHRSDARDVHAEQAASRAHRDEEAPLHARSHVGGRRVDRSAPDA